MMPIQFITEENGLEYPLALLHQSAFPEHEYWKPEDFKTLMALPTHSACVYMDKENVMLGFLFYSKIIDEAEIVTFAVSPSFQGRGIGKAILEQFIKKMKMENIKSVFLEVAEDNKKAYQLYCNYNFEVQTKRVDYYGKNKNAYLMLKSLS